MLLLLLLLLLLLRQRGPTVLCCLCRRPHPLLPLTPLQSRFRAPLAARPCLTVPGLPPIRLASRHRGRGRWVARGQGLCTANWVGVFFLFKRRKFKGSPIKSRIAVEGDYFGGGGGKPRAGGPAAAPAHCRMPSLVTGSPLPALALVRAFARCQSCRPFWRSPCNQPFRQGCRGRPVLAALLQVKVGGAPKANALFLLPALVPLYQI